MYHLLIFDFSTISYESLKVFTFFGTLCILDWNVSSRVGGGGGAAGLRETFRKRFPLQNQLVSLP